MTDTVGTASDTSPEALLKQAVMGGRTRAGAKPAIVEAPAVAAPTPWTRRIDPRLAGLLAAALFLGGVFGAGAGRFGAAGDDGAATALAEIQHRLGAAQAETDRLTATLAEIGKTLTHVKDGADAARGEARTRAAAVVERIVRSEQTLTARLATLSERIEQSEKDQAGRVAALTAQMEKRTTPPAPVALKAAPEPTETGAIPDAKAHTTQKPPVTDNWAVREVYDGVAVLEDRKRRLVEVGIGDTVPGVGRIETIERRGRTWAVVTRQGIITAQTW